MRVSCSVPSNAFLVKLPNRSLPIGLQNPKRQIPALSPSPMKIMIRGGQTPSVKSTARSMPTFEFAFTARLVAHCLPAAIAFPLAFLLGSAFGTVCRFHAATPSSCLCRTQFARPNIAPQQAWELWSGAWLEIIKFVCASSSVPFSGSTSGQTAAYQFTTSDMLSVSTHLRAQPAHSRQRGGHSLLPAKAAAGAPLHFPGYLPERHACRESITQAFDNSLESEKPTQSGIRYFGADFAIILHVRNTGYQRLAQRNFYT